jgi:hypothetical protein
MGSVLPLYSWVPGLRSPEFWGIPDPSYDSSCCQVKSSSYKIFQRFRVLISKLTGNFVYYPLRSELRTATIYAIYLPLLVFFVPLAYLTSSTDLSPDFHIWLCSTFRFSQPPSGLLRLMRKDLISCLFRLWDFPFRAFPFQRFGCLSATRLPS